MVMYCDIMINGYMLSHLTECPPDAITSNTAGIYELIETLNIKQYFNETQLNRYGNKQQDIGVVALPDDFWDGEFTDLYDYSDFFEFCAEERVPALYFG